MMDTCHERRFKVICTVNGLKFEQLKYSDPNYESFLSGMMVFQLIVLHNVFTKPSLLVTDEYYSNQIFSHPAYHLITHCLSQTFYRSSPKPTTVKAYK